MNRSPGLACLRQYVIVAASVVALAVAAALLPGDAAYASHCTFPNRTPSPGSVVFDTTPILATNVNCPVPITAVTMTLDGGSITPHVGGQSETRQSLFFEVPTPLAAGTHTVRVDAVAGAADFTEWSFTIPAPSPCGTATPSGGVYPGSGLAFVVWVGATPCPPSAAATNIALGSGKTVDAMWYFEHASGVWRYYLPSLATGSLTAVPATAALAAILS